MTDDQGKNGRQSARSLVSVLATVFGGFGIALQQLSTGEPGSLSRWVMLVIGSFIGGAVGILATGLFDRLLNVAGVGWAAAIPAADRKRKVGSHREIRNMEVPPLPLRVWVG